MILPLSWLKEYVDVDVTPDELEKKLFDAGFEVEEKYEAGKDISNIVVGLVESCEPIPDTHLHVCQVNAGTMEPFRYASVQTMYVQEENSLWHCQALLFMQQQRITRQ